MSEQYYWDEFHGVNAAKLGHYLTQKELTFIESFLAEHKIKKCLEIGCGSGRLSRHIIKHKIDLTGIDIDQTALKILNQRYPKIKTRKVDASQKLPFTTSSFDCIMAIEFLDYLTDLDSFFAEVSRVLASGGFFLFTCGNGANYKKWLQQKFGRHQGRYLFTTPVITISLSRNNLKLLKLQGYNWLPVRRESNNPLIPVFAHLEKYLGLESLTNFSPSVIGLTQNEKN